MIKTKKSIFSRNQLIDSKYKVDFFLKKGSYAETYRVKDQNNNTKVLKLFCYSQFDKGQFNKNNDIIEIEVLKQLNHVNLLNFIDNGQFELEEEKYGYAIVDFISGETLADKMARDNYINPYEAKEIIVGVLEGVKYLHQLKNPIIHNEITNLNVMLDLSATTNSPRLIDFGYARFLKEEKNINKEELSMFYLSNESLNDIWTIQSDLYAVGVLYYHLLFGLPPWFEEAKENDKNARITEEILINERKKGLKFLNTESGIDQKTKSIIAKALEYNPKNRFRDADEFIQTINGVITIEEAKIITEKPTKKSVGIKKKININSGFKAIAGMQNLKDQLRSEVIDVIDNPEEYRAHDIGIPNGLLLYGPPGCGKTFFAEKFAEEAGYHFIKVSASDIASIYIHGTQEKISKLFEEARKNAPTILFFDELDAMIPSRDQGINQNQSGEVNEFLTQLDNVGDSGVFVIGSTNKPETIDIAALRAGRIEKLFYIPPPDDQARKELFELYLKNRPKESDIDFDKLASLTEDYVSSDIKLIVDQASRKAIKHKQSSKRDNSNITELDLESIIKKQTPSLPKEVLKKYDAMRKLIEKDSSDPDDKPTIGFKFN